MDPKPSIANLTERERELLALHALAELTPAEAAEWQRLSAARPELAELTRDAVELSRQLAASGAAQAEMPRQVEERLDAMRARMVSDRSASRWRRYSVIALPLAAALVFGFVLLHESPPPRQPGDDSGGIKNAPVTFPDAGITIQAPLEETTLLRPAIIWKGTPGMAYDARIIDDLGKVLAAAEGVQSPWLLENDLPPGSHLTMELRPQGKPEVTTKVFRVSSNATPLAPNLKEQMERLAADGRKADALMVLMRLPEGALTEEAWMMWRERLTER